MNSFDALIARTKNVLNSLDEPDHGSYVASIPPAQELPITIGPHAGRGIVLLHDTAVELGGSNSSCGIVLVTSNTSLVRDDTVTIHGDDIPRLYTLGDTRPAEAVPFAQVIFAAGKSLTPNDFPALEQCQHVKDYIDGYLVRSSTGQVRSRVSHQLADKGFSFAMLASALSRIAKEACPSVESIEVAFVAGSADALGRLEPLRTDWIQKAHDTRKARWLEKGIDIDCSAGGHCGSCADKTTCERVRAIARMRKKGRAAHD